MRTNDALKVVVAALLAGAMPAAAQVFDVTADFSVKSNPNGPWEYGWSAQLSTAFELFDTAVGGTTWNRGEATYPDAGMIVSQFTVSSGGGGASGGTEYGIVRWTAPQRCVIEYGLAISGYWDNPLVDADLHLIGPAGELWTGVLERRPLPAQLLSGRVRLDAGESLELRVGVGENGLGDWDRAAIAGTVTVVACDADWNADGVVNSTDVSDFINDWFVDQVNGTLVADWDGNGVVNSTDVSSFINVWFEDIAGGCG